MKTRVDRYRERAKEARTMGETTFNDRERAAFFCIAAQFDRLAIYLEEEINNGSFQPTA